MAAQLEETLEEASELIESSGGVFEVEDQGVVIFSKSQTHRFPDDGEVLETIRLRATGISLEEAQAQAGAKAATPPTFLNWFKQTFGSK